MSSTSIHGPDHGADRQGLFRDLRDRNERRARLAQVVEAQRERRLKIERVVQAQRERRLRQAG